MFLNREDWFIYRLDVSLAVLLVKSLETLKFLPGNALCIKAKLFPGAAWNCWFVADVIKSFSNKAPVSLD